MKSTKPDLGDRAESHLDDLLLAISAAKSTHKLKEFLEDLCTPSELRSMADRWLVAKLLKDGIPYRTIYERTGVSTATITRVARSMSYGSGGYTTVLSQTQEAQS